MKELKEKSSSASKSLLNANEGGRVGRERPGRNLEQSSKEWPAENLLKRSRKVPHMKR